MIFYMPVKIIWGTIEEIPDYLPNGKICIVTGKHFTRMHGYNERFKNVLKNRELFFYNKISPNPSIQEVQEGINYMKEIKPDIVIGFGGGSVMDAAKVMATLWKNEDITIEDVFYFNKTIGQKGSFYIAIPTTTGTGSEVTQYAVFTKGKDKHGIGNDNLFANIAFLTLEPVMKQSNELLIDSAIDALTHALEGYLSLRNKGMFDNMALRAIKLMMETLPSEVSLRTKSGMETIQSIATTAGLVIAQRGTTLLHAAGYPLTTEYNISHGRSNMLLLPAFLHLMQQKDVDIKPILQYMKINAPSDIYIYMEDLGVSMDLIKYGIEYEQLLSFAEDVYKKRNLMVTPGNITVEDIKYMYKVAYEGI